MIEWLWVDRLGPLAFSDVLWIAWLAWAVTVIVGMLAERRSPVATLAWTLALLLLPIVGAVIYVAFGPRRLQRRRLRYVAASDAVVRTALARLHATRSHRPFRGARRARQLAALVDRCGEGVPVRSARVAVLPEGDGSYAAIEAAIASATHHIHLEYYIWDPDAMGQRLRDLLCERARQGVTVRVLLDGVGSWVVGARFWRPLTDAGGMVAWFNAFRPLRWRPHLFNFRTHRKLVVVDGRVGFTGGINVSVRHSGRHTGARAWRDTHVEIVGEPVRKLQRIFLEDWYFSADSDRPLAADIEQLFPDLRGGEGPWTQVVASGPDDSRAAIHRFYFAAITLAARRVWLTTPYFVPDDAIQAALVSAALRGVDVQLMVPRKGDSRLVAAASRTYYDDMAAAGVKVHEYGPPMLHAKTLVVDEDIGVVGTANIDNRSFRLNFELIAVMYDRGVAAELASQFDADRARAVAWRRPSRRRLKRLSTVYDRFVDSLARLFSPVL